MKKLLSNLLNIRPGERRRLLVLYVMLFIFSNGITWSGSVAEAAFMNQAGLGVAALPLIIMADAVVSVLAIIVYTAFVDRIPNDRLLIGLLIGFAACVGFGRYLIDSGQPIAAYTLLFVVYRASDSIFLLHWWTYVSEFYDIRAFKRLAPVILSAKTLGIMTSGFTLPILTRFFNTAEIMVLWGLSQLVIVLICALAPLLVKTLARRNVYRASRREPFIQNIREGYRYVRRSTYLLWFALGSLALAIAAALFQSLSSAVLQATYPDQTSYANFLGMMNTIGGLITFPLQLFLMNRIINRVGVGNGMMLYPISMGISSAALLLFPPQMLNAALGVLNRSVLRLAFRAPVMGLVYNVVPMKVRGRARAFVSGLVEPVGAVLGASVLLLIPRLGIPNLLGIVLAAAVIVYLLATLATRRLYSTTLVETLQDEEYSAMLDGDAVLTADPTLANQLKLRLSDSANADDAFFNTRLLLEIGGSEALFAVKQALTAFATDSDKQRAILNALVSAETPAADIYLTFIAHPDQRLRQVAIDGIEEMKTLTATDSTLLYQRLGVEPDTELQARLIPIVVRSKTFAHSKAAHERLRSFLASDDLSEVLSGLKVVATIHEERYLDQVTPLLRSVDDAVRLGAVSALAALTRHGIQPALTIHQLDDLQQDPVERIREVTLSILKASHDPEAHDLLLNGFRDPSLQVQKTAVAVLVSIGRDAIPLLLTVLQSDELTLRKLASAALCQIQPRRYRHLIEAHILTELAEIHQNYRQLFALSGHSSNQGVRILSTTLREQNQAYLDDIFYLLSSVSSPHIIATLREALESDSAAIRSGAIEALEWLVSADTARLVSALFDQQTLNSFMNGMNKHDHLGATLTTEQALRQLISDPEDSWLRAAAVFALSDLDSVFTPQERDQLLGQALNDSFADVRQAARIAQRWLQPPSKVQPQEQQMISLIERIMFLKQVAIFQSIPLEQLKAIAAVCEPEFFKANTTVFQQGEASGGLYVVTSGQIAIQVKRHQAATHVRLATLGVNAYFGEMSLFNERPRSASALALQDTELLKLSRVSFIRLVRQFPDMSLTLLDVLSQRLAEVNEQLAER